jgi:hypothetical protein
MVDEEENWSFGEAASEFSEKCSNLEIINMKTFVEKRMNLSSNSFFMSSRYFSS